MDPVQNQTQQTSPAPQSSAPVAGTAVGGEKNTLMGVLSYIGILVLIPLFTAKDDPFVKYHVKQGLVLFVIEVANWFLVSMIWMLAPVTMLVNLACLVLAIIGIINVVKGEEKELPIVGKFASHFKI